MPYIKFEHRQLGSDRWLDISPAAFTVHVWALDHCNEQATDGLIATSRAHRLVCPVPAADLPGAFAELVDRGVWILDGAGYRCPDFLAHGIAAEEQSETRAKWAADKRRRRLHAVGNHSLCTANSKCADSTGGQLDGSTDGQITESTSGQVDDPTRPNPTRPDQTPEGSGEGSGEDGGAHSVTPKVHSQAEPPRCEDHPAKPAANCVSCWADVKAGQRPPDQIGRRWAS